jgi:imidazolonepropionase-like amidohydrolase
MADGPGRSTVLRGRGAFDGTSLTPLVDPVLVVRDGTIQAIGPAGELDVPAGATEIDLGDSFLVPGLIDAHVHLAGDRTFDAGDQLTVPRELRVLRAAQDAASLLRAGFTTVRDCGSSIALVLRRAIAEKTVPGPDILAAGPIICQTGGHADLHYRAWESMGSDPESILADGVDACRQAVRRVVRSGADLVKICTSGGVGSVSTSPHDVHFTDTELAAIVDEAHRLGRRVAAHAQGKAGILAAVRAGVDSVEHGYFLDDEAAEAMVRSGTWLVPTSALMIAFRAGLEDPSGLPEHRRRKQSQALHAMPTALGLAYRCGISIAAGSDYLGVPHRRHGDNADEAIEMVAHGVSAGDACRFITSNAAELLGRADRTGRLAPGMQADVVAVTGNPLQDIGSLKRVRFVMKSGQVVRDDAEPAMPPVRS